MNTLEPIIDNLVKNRIKNREDLARAKRKAAKKYKIPCPDNISLLKTYHELAKKKKIEKSALLEFLLRKRPVRSLSGIVNISVLTKPYPCPGKCLFCPQEKGIPKSYLSGEPAVERAKRLGFDPYWQTKKRIESLALEGHPTDKIELRVVGGTWSYYPKEYQRWFIANCFAACNAEQRQTAPARTETASFVKATGKRRVTLKDLEREQKKNEKTKHRIIGLSVETRPDFVSPKEVKRLRGLGVTMVELGVQSIYDPVLKKNLRGHGKKETIRATKLLKDAGFKILYQMMPNLPGSDLKKDKEMFKELFSVSDFQPDMLKIYPCALLQSAPLYKIWKKGKYKPYSQSQLTELIKSIKKTIPYYVRIQRISRDIPSGLIVAGPAKISNLRQILTEDMKNKGWQCKCIRCREVRENYDPKEKVRLFRENYQASGAKEVFLSFENKKRSKLYSLLRLRLTSGKKAVVREIHTYGQQLLLQGCRDGLSAISPQHKGLGKKLIKEAEKITKKEFNLNELSVIAGIGARSYFRKLGYRLKDSYMAKNLSQKPN